MVSKYYGPSMPGQLLQNIDSPFVRQTKHWLATSVQTLDNTDSHLVPEIPMAWQCPAESFTAPTATRCPPKSNGLGKSGVALRNIDSPLLPENCNGLAPSRMTRNPIFLKFVARAFRPLDSSL